MLLELGELAGAVGLDERGEHDERDEDERGGGAREGGAVASPVALQQLPRGVGVSRDDPAGLEALEIGGHVRGGAVTGGRIAGHGLVDDRGELVGQPRHELLERARRRLDDVHQDAFARRVVVGRDGAEDVVEHGAEGVDVGPRVDREADGLLGRHVRGRAHDRTVDGETLAGAGGGLGERLVLGEVLRQAPVDHDSLAELAHQDVGGLEVAMDDLLAVRVGDGLGGGEDVRQQGQPLGERFAAGDQVGERTARDQLHGVERLALGPARGLVDRHDGGVLQPRGEQRLSHEALLLPFVPHQQLLDRHRPVEPAVLRLRDAADAALGDLVADAVGVARDAGQEARELGQSRGRGRRSPGRLEGVRVAGGGRCAAVLQPILGALSHPVLRAARPER
ncbi:hypothetical protein [Nannocystis sp. SCPEA4]|uniref:hypothetical protein n=1 Tax=Nannocystis sp. SCPEA4 TaxID=2996787 RepID=UPI0022712FEA|nr:hypothetical protein [Nannocystis sp. SCPEA4]